MKGKKAKQIVLKAERALLRERIFHCGFTIHKLQIQRKELEDEIHDIVGELMAEVKDFMASVRMREAAKCRERQKLKFDKLKSKFRGDGHTTSREEEAKLKERWVINRSDRTLSNDECKVLSRGLKFAVTPREVPTYDIITSTEEACYRIKDSKIAQSLRSEVVKALKSAHPPKSNISKEERLALKSLREDKNIEILPADKGCATVVLNKSEYTTKMDTLVNDVSTYKSIKKDPTDKYRAQLVKILNQWRSEETIPDNLCRFLKPTGGVPPRIYGLPKIHKANIPLRPIVSSLGSVTYNVAKYLARILSPLVGKTEHFVKDSRDFVSKIKDLEVPPGHKLISYDVSALFTSIPTPDALRVIRTYLESDTTLCDRSPLSVDQLLGLLEFCLNTTYFVYQGNFYQQTHGAAMGSPVSPLVANIYMEDFEQKALASAPHPPSIWLRYVDDTFVQIGEDYILEFTNHINNQDPNIKFTNEPETEGSIPFLDVRVHLNDDGSTKTTVYRKPTHTDQYLNGLSHHPLEHKRSVVRSLLNRADNIVSDPHDRSQEVSHIKKVLKVNNFDPFMLDIPRKKNFTPNPATHQQAGGARQLPIAIPYIKGLSERLQRVFRDHGVSIYHKPHNTIRQSLVSPKDKLGKMNKDNAIYEITCGHCEQSYIGETGRTLKVRFGEHVRDSTPITAVTSHIHTTGHNIISDDVKVLDTEEHWYRRKVKEALFIQEKRPPLNRDQGLDLPAIYQHVVSRGEVSTSPSHVTQH
jgi:hypothetical protein